MADNDVNVPDRNLALELVRVTEAAAMAASRWMGRGDKLAADGAAVEAMRTVINTVGMDGIVASPAEATAVRRIVGPAIAIVTPGIRPAGADSGDQRRIATPGTAIGAGADYLVVGRPINAAADPKAAAEAIVAEIETAVTAKGET